MMETRPVRRAVAASLSLGITIGFYDLALSVIRSAPEGLGRLLAVLPPVAATTTAVALLSALVLIPPALLPERRLRLRNDSLTLALTAVLGSFLVLGDFYGLLQFEQTAATEQTMLLVACLSITLGACLYQVSRSAWGGAGRVLAASCVAIPLVTGAGLLSAWVGVYRPPALPGGALPWCLGGFLLCAAAVAVIARSLALRRLAERSLAVLALLVMSPLLTIFAGRADGPPAASPAARGGAIRHIILLSIDTLRADAVSFLAPGAGPTPHLDALAADAIVYTRAYSASPWTLPAFASIMTGVAPSVHGVRRPTQRIPAALPTLAERLRAAGYRTAAVGRNPWLRPRQGLSRGFDSYDVCPRDERGRSVGMRILARLDPARDKPTLSTSEITGFAVDWLRRNAGSDFFLWVHYLRPHGPYAPPRPYRPPGPPPAGIGWAVGGAEAIRGGEVVPTPAQRAWIRKLYEAEVRYVDDNVGRVLDELRRLGIYDDALIVLVSDHGEEFWDHGGFEHGHTVYDELLRVPLLIKRPGGDRGRRRDEVVATGSLYPSILGLCGVDVPSDTLSYASLFPWSTLDRPGPVTPVLGTALLYFEDREAVISGGTKYIRFLVTGREEVYDLARDPLERHEISASRPEAVRAGRAGAEAFEREGERLRRAHRLEEEAPVGLDPDTLKDLRSLGYEQ